MNNSVLEELNERLSRDRIPSRLIQEGKVLTVLFEPPTTDFDVYGDVFFSRYGGDEEGKEDGLLVTQWEVCDITSEPDDVHANLSIALSMMNAVLPAGGYLISAREGEDDSERALASVKLMYRLALPVGAVKNEKWLKEEAYDALATSAAVLKSTASALLDFARGNMSQEEFLTFF